QPERAQRGVHHPERLQQERRAGSRGRCRACRPRNLGGPSSSAPGPLGDPVTTRWSVVIPAFNEARRLPTYLDDVVAFFEGRGETYEVIVVDTHRPTTRPLSSRRAP